MDMRRRKRDQDRQVNVNWWIDLDTMKRGLFKVRPVSRKLINVDKLHETRAEKKKACLMLDVWIFGTDDPLGNRKLLGFCMAEVSFHSENMISPCSELTDKKIAEGWGNSHSEG